MSKIMETNVEKNSEQSQEDDVKIEIVKEVDKKSTTELWDEIGFHKPLAGFWYKIAFYLINLVLGLVLISIWYKYFYPYPESMGYRSAATGIFSLFFSLFDLGTHRTMDRYIAETRIKNPHKMIQYIQYFIWYQMITGLIQTTAVSIYAIYFVPKTQLAYAVWIMLFHSTTQYPGFLGCFRGVLNSLQYFDKTEILNFISGEVFQRLTEVGFVIWGRYYGINNPAVGEIMGIAIGATIGFYVDDFIATAFSAYWFQKYMKNYGIKVKDCFRMDFDRYLVIDTLTFGIKTGMPHIIGLAVSLVILWEWLTYVPQYTTFVTLHDMAGGISGLVNQAMGIRLSMLISESYLNDKEKLTQYYIGQYVRFSGQIQAFMISLILIVFMVLPQMYPALGLSNYILSIPFIIPRLIRELQQPLTSLADEICLGTNHPTWLMTIRLLEELMKIFWMTLWIVWLRLPDKYGLNAIIWIMPCGIYPAILFKTVASFIFIQKKILKIKVPWWQSYGASLLSGSLVFIIGLIGKFTVFDYFASLNLPIIG
ncbi:MAG: hypothetical protein GF364_00470, partial [Candidatus Lokiarchaeota archaeon]|nr:hypothetical protein [Candidatus Lokiarchaeota archaeon]